MPHIEAEAPTWDRLPVILLILAAILIQIPFLHQPIYENAIGRQIPTAMVARNLDRGSSFGSPALDTGPFPSLFLIEPPVFAAVAVGIHQLTGLRMEPAGRLAAVLGLILSLWGLHGLARRDVGSGVALPAVIAFAIFPLTIRYGRAFQPDSLALGLVLAGLRLKADSEKDTARRNRLRNALSWLLLACAIFMKAYLAIYGLLWVAFSSNPLSWRSRSLGVILLVPALLWYVHAIDLQFAQGVGGSSSVNFEVWISNLFTTRSLNVQDIRSLAMTVVVRSFTPVGFILGSLGLLSLVVGRFQAPAQNRCSAWMILKKPGFWLGWLALTLGMLFFLRHKLHQEYYFLLLAPPMAVGCGVMAAWLARQGVWGRISAQVSFGLLIALGIVGSASTWSTPAEWTDLDHAAAIVRQHVPGDTQLVAPEALLYASDRRGCRLELDPESVIRAAREWQQTLNLDAKDQTSPDAALALVACYRSRGAAILADLGAAPRDPRRRAFHDALRGRYAVRVDRPEVLIVDLSAPAIDRSALRWDLKTSVGPSVRPISSPGKHQAERSPF